MFYDHDPSNTCSTWTYLYYSPEFSSFEALGFDLVPFGHKPPQLELLGEFTTVVPLFKMVGLVFVLLTLLLLVMGRSTYVPYHSWKKAKELRGQTSPFL